MVSSQLHYLKKAVTFVSLLAMSLGLLSTCGESFMKQKTLNESTASLELAATADAAGNYTSAIDPNSKTTQVLRAAGTLSGSAIALPPGALGIDLSITIGSGETLTSTDISQQIGLGDNTASAAGPSVSFVPSQNVQASTPFTLSIPVSGTSLALASTSNDNLVVMYKWMKVENGVTSFALGIITRDQLTIGSKAVQFQTDKFGTFQLAVTQTKITAPISVPTSEPPVLKNDATNPLVGVWSQCYANSNYSYNSSSSSSTTSGGSTSLTGTVDPAWVRMTPTVLTTACSGLNISLSVTVANPASAAIPYSYQVFKDNSSQTQPVELTSAATTLGTVTGNVSLYMTSEFTPTPNNVLSGNYLYIQLSPNCHFTSYWSDPTSTALTGDRYYFTGISSMSSSTVYITCDQAAYDALNVASSTPSTGGTSTSTSTNDGGGKDRLGIPANALANYSSREYVKFSASTFVHSRSLFTDSNCGGSMISRVEETGSYKLSTTKADGTMPITITFATNTGTIFLDQSVTFANNNSVASGCGFTDWVVNSPRDLTSSQYCNNNNKDGKSSGPSIVQIKDNKIYFDDGGSGVINTKDSMTRQQ